MTACPPRRSLVGVSAISCGCPSTAMADDPQEFADTPAGARAACGGGGWARAAHLAHRRVDHLRPGPPALGARGGRRAAGPPPRTGRRGGAAAAPRGVEPPRRDL